MNKTKYLAWAFLACWKSEVSTGRNIWGAIEYEPCYIYELGATFKLDSLASMQETRKASKGRFEGFKRARMHNPDYKEEDFLD